MCNSPVHYIAAKIKALLSQTVWHAAQSLLALGGVGIIEDGELCWPPPGHTTICCNFGEPDAYGKMEAANMIASKINLGELPEKKKSPKRKLLRRKAPLGELVRQNQRKINPFCLSFGIKVADKMADKPKSCLPHKKYLSR